MTRDAWIRIAPFALFMGFIAVEQGAVWWFEKSGTAAAEVERLRLFVYPLKAVVVAGLLVVLRRHYDELRAHDLRNVPQVLLSLLVGVLVFVLWVNMDWEFARFGEASGYNPLLVEEPLIRNGLITLRLFGAVLVVPFMEELFWRSFLLRYIINADFLSVRIGTYSLSSFIVGTLLFGVEHHLVLAGIMAGIAYSLLLYRTRSIAHCVLAHAVTNLCLGLYVLWSGLWYFW